MRSIGSAASAASMVAERRPHDPLVGPARPRHDRHRAVGAVERRELGDHPRQRVHREVDRERRAGRAEGRQRLALGHRRGAAGDAGQHEALRDLGDGQLAPERRRRGGEGRDARGQRVGDAARARAGAPARRPRSRSRGRPSAAAPRPARRRAPRRTRPRSRRATAARCRPAARPAGSAPAAPAAPPSRRRGRPGSAPSRSRPRTVMRSAAPGPAPMKCTVMPRPPRPRSRR